MPNSRPRISNDAFCLHLPTKVSDNAKPWLFEMKVLHVLASVGPLRGGPGFVLRSMATGLAERGLQIDVVTTNDNGPERLDVPLFVARREEGVTYRYFPRQSRLYTISFPLAIWLWKNVRSYDLIHIHAVFTFASTVTAWIARLRKIPYVVRPLGILNQWGLNNNRPLLKKLSLWAIDRRILEHAALIHYTSDSERAEAQKVGICSPCVIIPNPVDTDLGDRDRYLGKFRVRYPKLANRQLVIFLSRIAEKKGIDLLISAFSVLVRSLPGTALVIAGSGDRELIDRLKAQVRDAGLTEYVHWVGFVQGEEKNQLLADGDVFVLPSHSENFGVAVIEALALRLPVIVSDQVGIHDQISEYGAGIVIPCEVGALAKAMAEILSRPRLSEEMRSNTSKLLTDRFSRQRVLDLLMKTYGAILRPDATAAIRSAEPGLPIC